MGKTKHFTVDARTILQLGRDSIKSHTTALAELIKNKVPKCFGTFEYNQKDVIILQNLNNFTGQFNIDLNYNIDILFNVISTISEIHNKYYFRSNKEIINSMLKLKTVKQITYYSELIHNRFDKFMLNNDFSQEKNMLHNSRY